jgi:hypothetical protein
MRTISGIESNILRSIASLLAIRSAVRLASVTLRQKETLHGSPPSSSATVDSR